MPLGEPQLSHEKMKTLFFSNMSKSRRLTSNFFPTTNVLRGTPVVPIITIVMAAALGELKEISSNGLNEDDFRARAGRARHVITSAWKRRPNAQIAGIISRRKCEKSS